MPPQRLSDEEKKRRGTFRANQSADAQRARLASKIVTGVFLSEIPEPTLPLGEKGSVRRNEYDRLAQMLYEQGNLTHITLRLAEVAANTYGQMHDALSTGKTVSKHLGDLYYRTIAKLEVLEKAPNIASPGKKNKFEGHGWAHKAGSAVRLIKSA
jgi:hypothetical protein